MTKWACFALGVVAGRLLQDLGIGIQVPGWLYLGGLALWVGAVLVLALTKAMRERMERDEEAGP